MTYGSSTTSFFVALRMVIVELDKSIIHFMFNYNSKVMKKSLLIIAVTFAFFSYCDESVILHSPKEFEVSSACLFTGSSNTADQNEL